MIRKSGFHSRMLLLKIFLVIVVVISAAALIIFSPGSFAREESEESDKKIAVAMLSQETCTFSPVSTTLQDFKDAGLFYGEDILDHAREEQMVLGGFLQAVEDSGGEKIVPLVRARAVPSGPIERNVYERFKSEILQGLEEAMPLDGVYLALHGAMGVEGLHDPEGDLLTEVRKIVGDEIPVGVSFDLHANVTPRRVEMADFIVGYKTNPHRDHYETGYLSGEILARTMRGEVKPVMGFSKMRLLKGGGLNIDFLPPMYSIFQRMHQMEGHPEILSVSNYMVHIWLDDPELSWSTLVVADGNLPLAQAKADELADKNWAVRDVDHPRGYTPAEAVEEARRLWWARLLGVVMICDAYDSIEAGAPGETTWILKELLESAPDLTSYTHLRDPFAAEEAFDLPLNETVTLTVGGRFDKEHSVPVDVTGEIIYREEGNYGKTAVLRSDGVYLVITELRISPFRPEFYTALGLNLWDADIVVVKNLFPFRINYLLYNRRTINVGAPGVTNVDVFEIDYQNVPRPIYPLDDIDDWRW